MDIFYWWVGWVRVGGGIFQVDGGGWLFSIGRRE